MCSARLVLDSDILQPHLSHRDLQEAGALAARLDEGEVRRRSGREHQPGKSRAATEVQDLAASRKLPEEARFVRARTTGITLSIT